jgi:hypothetical protein
MLKVFCREKFINYLENYKETANKVDFEIKEKFYKIPSNAKISAWKKFISRL